MKYNMKVINGERFQNLCETQISKKEHKYLAKGGKFITHVPIVKIS